MLRRKQTFPPSGLSKLYRFLRPTIAVVVCYLLALVVVRSIFIRADASSDTTSIEASIKSLTKPSPEYSPQEVVEIQLAAMTDANRSQGTLQCMTFASPGNRIVTGPLERFGRMLRSDKYLPLSDSEGTAVGSPLFQEGAARILVTVITKGQLHSYIWVLRKQDAAPFQDCWMTEGVFAVGSHTTPSPLKPGKVI